jgi:hypothetical protein
VFNTDLIGLGYKGFCVFNQEGKVIFNSNEMGFDRRVYEVFEIGRDSVLLGTDQGLYSFVDKVVRRVAVAGLSPRDRVEQLERFGDYLIVGTSGSGSLQLKTRAFCTFLKAMASREILYKRSWLRKIQPGSVPMKV